MMHGFFDVEERSCTTVHRLAKVCLQTVFSAESGQWESIKIEEDAAKKEQVV